MKQLHADGMIAPSPLCREFNPVANGVAINRCVERLRDLFTIEGFRKELTCRHNSWLNS